MTVDIYHGPYATYTPVDLQVKKQREYLKRFPFYRFWDQSNIILRAKVVEKLELGYDEVWEKAFEENCRSKNLALFSVNTFYWLYLAKGNFPCDELDTLAVVGYKKAQRPYYLLRFVTHKGGHFPVTEEEFSEAVYILNEKEFSGSTHVTPEIYLLENCTRTMPQVMWESKSSMIKELVAYKSERTGPWRNSKRYPIGVISDLEYNELLDDGIRDSLIFRDVMVNIPHDPLVIVKKVWVERDKSKYNNIICKIGRTFGLPAKEYSYEVNMREYLKKAGLMVDKDEKIEYLQKMYRYYVSLGILRKRGDEYYIYNPQRGNNLNLLPDGPGVYDVHFYKVEYGDLGDHYYRFREMGKQELTFKEGLIIAAGERLAGLLDEKLGYRVYLRKCPDDKKDKEVGGGKCGTPVDTLITERDSCLYDKK